MALDLCARSRFVSFGRFTFDRETGAMTRDNLSIEMNEASVSLLQSLLSRANTVVAYHQLAGTEQPMRSAPTAMRTAMKELRRRLRDPVDYPLFIETVRGVGYRFVAPLREVVDVSDAGMRDEGDSLPSPNLVRWSGDDDASVGFAVVWLIASSTLVPSLVGWMTLPIALVPGVIRLGFRFVVFRGLQRDGVSTTDLRRALGWADERPAVAAVHGRRAVIRRAATFSSVAALVAVLLAHLAIRFQPWTWSTVAQEAAGSALMVTFGVVVLSVGMIVVDALVNPQPLLQRIRARACRAWRALLERTLPEAGDDDVYRLAADREVNILLSTLPLPAKTLPYSGSDLRE